MVTDKDDPEQIGKTSSPWRKRYRAWIALLAIAGVLILGEVAFQWARGRGWSRPTGTPHSAEAMILAPDGAVWIGSNNVILRFGRERWTTYGKGDGLRDGFLIITIAPDGTVWAGSHSYQVSKPDYVYRFDGEEWTSFQLPDDKISVVSVTAASGDDVWVRTSRGNSNGVYRFDGERWNRYSRPGGVAANDVRTIFVSPRGTVWFGTKHGAIRFDGEKWIRYNIGNGLPLDDIQCIAVAADGTLWVGTTGGVVHFDEQSWTAYTEADGLPYGYVQSIAVSPDGTLWVGTRGGLVRFDGDNWITYNKLNSDLSSNSIKALAIDEKGRVWILPLSGGVRVFDESVAVPGEIIQAWSQVWLVLRFVGGGAVLLLIIRIALQALRVQSRRARSRKAPATTVLATNRKRARNWYWWLWLSPLLTLPTLSFWTGIGMSVSYRLVCGGSYRGCDYEKVALIVGILGSALWHLILLIPARDKQDIFVRWHGRQMLRLAGARTAVPLGFALLFGFDFGALLFVPVQIGIWFFGTLRNQRQAIRGECSLLRRLGTDEELLALRTATASPQTRRPEAKADVEALVRTIRFARDSEARRKAVEELKELGLVEEL